jgi:hypothetical protein
VLLTVICMEKAGCLSDRAETPELCERSGILLTRVVRANKPSVGAVIDCQCGSRDIP